MTQRPLDMLDLAKEKNIIIKLKNEGMVTGILQAFDLHLNIWIKNAVYTPTVPSNVEKVEKSFGSTLIRGDTIILISQGE